MANLKIKDENGNWVGITSIQGEQGPPGKDGTMSFADLTEEQKASLKGEPGTNGTDGKDGTSCTHSWNGTTLTITSASGTSSADLKGEPGEPGKDGADGVVDYTNYYNKEEIDALLSENGEIESGENENGRYIKFADGTMICTGSVSGNSTMHDYWGQFKRTQEDISASFPAEFINAPFVVATPYYHSGLIAVLIGRRNTNDFTFTGLKASENSEEPYSFYYQAIGKWK